MALHRRATLGPRAYERANEVVRARVHRPKHRLTGELWPPSMGASDLARGLLWGEPMHLLQRFSLARAATAATLISTALTPTGAAASPFETPILWYAANVGSEGFACGACKDYSYPGCGCDDWLSCNAGICEAAGGENESCWWGQTGAIATYCDPNLGCVDGQCIRMGTEGEACRGEAEYRNAFLAAQRQPERLTPDCDPGLFCNGSYCEATPSGLSDECAGQQGCECLDSGRYVERCAASELMCDQSLKCRSIWDMTLRALWASQAVYDGEDGEHDKRAQKLRRVDLNFVSASPKLDRSPYAIVAENDWLIMVAVSGSNDWEDWIANADALDSPWSYVFPGLFPITELDAVDMVDPYQQYSSGWAPCTQPHRTGCSLPRFKVHQGFLAYAHDLYWSHVKREVSRLHAARPRAIQIVGHSLGGAVAQLLALQITTHLGLPIDAVVTFGSPKVGDANWKTAYESLLHRATHRWVNGKDPVPNVPLKDAWKRAGQQHYIFVDGERLELDGSAHARNMSEAAADYHPIWGAYKAKLEALAPCDHLYNEDPCWSR